MNLRAPGSLSVSLAAAVALNVALLFAAAFLTREKPFRQDMSSPVAVHLVSLKPPAPPPPEEKREIPRPEPKPTPDFRPELPSPTLSMPGLPEVSVALDPSLFAGTVTGGDFVFNAEDLDTPPTHIVRSVEYPIREAQRNIEGYVKVKFLVNVDGSISRLEILESRPAGIFDAAVLRGAPRWKYRPGTIDGRAVPSWVVTPVEFKLND